MNTQWVKNIFKAVMSRGMAAEMDEEEKRDEGKLADNSFQRVDSALKWKCSYKVSQLITRKGVVVVHFREKKKKRNETKYNKWNKKLEDAVGDNTSLGGFWVSVKAKGQGILGDNVRWADHRGGGGRAAAESQTCWERGELGVPLEDRAQGTDGLRHHEILRDTHVLDQVWKSSETVLSDHQSRRGWANVQATEWDNSESTLFQCCILKS